MISASIMTSINPMPMALSILTISVMASIIVFKKSLISWMAFVLILTFSSGMMTLFVYVASLTPNEKMKTKKSIWTILIIIVLLSLPLSNPETMKTSMKMFSSQFVMLVMALTILLSMLAIAMQGQSPNQTATSNF